MCSIEKLSQMHSGRLSTFDDDNIMQAMKCWKLIRLKSETE